jgi:hypothetical protein
MFGGRRRWRSRSPRKRKSPTGHSRFVDNVDLDDGYISESSPEPVIRSKKHGLELMLDKPLDDICEAAHTSKMMTKASKRRWPRSLSAKGSGRHRNHGNGSACKRGHSPVLLHLACELQMGTWHFGGHRQWSWMHDGKHINGWIQFCAQGILRTNLCHGQRGTWELRADIMIVAFGNCCHHLSLLPASLGGLPGFKVTERVMQDGSAAKSACRSRGRLCTEAL